MLDFKIQDLKELENIKDGRYAPEHLLNKIKKHIKVFEVDSEQLSKLNFEGREIIKNMQDKIFKSIERIAIDLERVNVILKILQDDFIMDFLNRYKK